MFEGRRLFCGDESILHTYQRRAHIAEMISLLGPPPPDLLSRARQRSEFFSEEGRSPRSWTVPGAAIHSFTEPY